MERWHLDTPLADDGDLLELMDCVMQMRGHPDGLWHARATGAGQYAAASTPGAAMRAALAYRTAVREVLRTAPKPVRPRSSLWDET